VTTPKGGRDKHFGEATFSRKARLRPEFRDWRARVVLVSAMVYGRIWRDPRVARVIHRELRGDIVEATAFLFPCPQFLQVSMNDLDRHGRMRPKQIGPSKLIRSQPNNPNSRNCIESAQSAVLVSAFCLFALPIQHDNKARGTRIASG
jgi:hypothetical protein